jgi:sulfatase modifying factor 1
LERNTNEVRHSVTLTKGFYLCKFLVTQSNYLSLINVNPSYFKTNAANQGQPVEQASWLDASNYCYRLTQQERAAGRIFTNWAYRLPTEAEWEYACRAGTTNAFCYGTNLLSGMGNFNGEWEYLGGIGTRYNGAGVVLNRTAIVGTYPPNAWGLFDTAGNVWEWCQDWFGNYPTNSVTDPAGPATGTARVLRGGALNAPGRYCRAAYRDRYDPASAANTVGFRVALSYAP